MSLIYYLPLGMENKELEERVLQEVKKGNLITYILPTTAASIKYRANYIEKLGGFSNLRFLGFDSIRKKASKKQMIDGSFRKYIIQNIIRDGNFKELTLSSGMYENLANIINLGRENLVSPKDFENADSTLLKEVGEVFLKYEEFLNNSKYTDLAEVPEVNNDMGLVIFDGFYSMKKTDLALIEKILKNHEVLFNIPYALKDITYVDLFVNSLRNLGVDIKECDNLRTCEEFIYNRTQSGKIKYSSFKAGEEQNQLFKFLKADLINGCTPSVVNLCIDESTNVVSEFENLDVNYIRDNQKSIKLVQEFKTLVEYTIIQNRVNLIKRVNLKYFKLNTYNENTNNEILSMKFTDLNALKMNAQIELSSNIEITQFFTMLEELEVEIKSVATFKEYSEIFLEKLNVAENFIEEFYKKSNNLKIYKDDMQILQKLNAVLNKLKEYDEHFKFVSLIEYKNLLFDYLDNISLLNYDPYKIKFFSLDGSLKHETEQIYITGFNSEFPRYSKGNFILNTEKEFLQKIGYCIESSEQIYEKELLKLCICMANSEKVTILIDEEDESVYSTLIHAKNIDESRISTQKELFYKMIDGIEKNNFDEYLSMYEVNGNFNNILENIFEERLRNIGDNKITLSDNALELLKSKLDSRGFKVRDLDAWAKSAYSFLYLDLLGLKELVKTPKEEIWIEMGTEFHKILENYFKIYDVLDEDALKAEIDKVLFKNDATGVKKEIYFEILKKYIEADLNDREGFKPVEFEKNVSLNMGRWNLKGRIDRIDEKDGNYIVVDYKLSQAPSKKSIGDKAFQIAMYMMFFEGLCVEGKYGLIKKASTVHYIRNDSVLGKVSNRQKGFTQDEFYAILNMVAENAVDIFVSMYNGQFDMSGEIDECLKDLARGSYEVK